MFTERSLGLAVRAAALKRSLGSCTCDGALESTRNSHSINGGAMLGTDQPGADGVGSGYYQQERNEKALGPEVAPGDRIMGQTFGKTNQDS